MEGCALISFNLKCICHVESTIRLIIIICLLKHKPSISGSLSRIILLLIRIKRPFYNSSRISRVPNFILSYKGDLFLSSVF